MPAMSFCRTVRSKQRIVSSHGNLGGSLGTSCEGKDLAVDESTDEVLLGLANFIQPAIENGLVFGFDGEEGHPRSHVGLGVDDFRLGLEIGVTGGNLDEHQRSYGERIHHIQIAAVKAQLAHARGNAHIRSFLDQFGAGDEGISWHATAFRSQ
jgi:hypothetical protein